MEIKIFKKKKSFRKGGLHFDPDIYWEILLAMVFIIVVLSFILGFFLFRKINKGFISLVENTESQIEKISQERVKKTLEYFSLRKQKSDQILNSPSPIVDPSR